MEYFPPINGDQENLDRPYLNANPATGIEGSWPHAKAIEGSMREILSVIDAAGLPRNAGDFGQLLEAIGILINSLQIQMPPGTILPYGGLTVPTGFFNCDGAAPSRTTHASLFNEIGTTWGAGDGVNTFNLPDLRGEFLRGIDNGRGIDAGRTLGSFQLGSIIGFDCGPSYAYVQVRTATSAVSGVAQGQLGLDYEPNGSSLYPGTTMAIVGGSSNPLSNSAELGYGIARPRNKAVNFIIKY